MGLFFSVTAFLNRISRINDLDKGQQIGRIHGPEYCNFPYKILQYSHIKSPKHGITNLSFLLSSLSPLLIPSLLSFSPSRIKALFTRDYPMCFSLTTPSLYFDACGWSTGIVLYLGLLFNNIIVCCLSDTVLSP